MEDKPNNRDFPRNSFPRRAGLRREKFGIKAIYSQKSALELPKIPPKKTQRQNQDKIKRKKGEKLTKIKDFGPEFLPEIPRISQIAPRSHQELFPCRE